MKNISNVRVICVFICLFMIFLGAASYIVRIGTRTFISLTGKTNGFTAWLFKDQPTLNNQAENKPSLKMPEIVDWVSMYPFSEETLKKADEIKAAVENAGADCTIKVSNAEKQAVSTEAAAQQVQPQKVITMPSFNIPGKFELERWYNRFFRKEYFSQAMQKIEDKCRWNLMPPSGKSNIVTGAVKMTNGHLCVLSSRRDMTALAESIKSFDRFLKEQNIPFAYVMAPSSIAPDDKIISGHWDFSNQNAEELLQKLGNAGVNTIDLINMLKDDGISYGDAFFVTDHHWRPETGVWATGKIAEWLNKNAGLDCDVSTYKSENYDKKVYHEWFLGSYGRKATLARTKPDDISILFPKKQVQFHYVNPSAPCDRTGGFDVIYHYENIEPKDYYFQNSIGAYLNNKYAAFIDNLDENAKGKVLVVGDSFLILVAPFLAETVKRVEYLSLDYFDGSLESYIKQNGPYDACFVLFYTGDLTDSIDFTSHHDMFDLR